MIEELKKMSIEEQIKRLTNSVSLKEILYSTNDEELEEYMGYLFAPENLGEDETIDNNIIQVLRTTINESINDKDFIEYMLFNYSDYFDEFLDDIIYNIDDQFITDYINSDDVSRISILISYLSDKQLQHHKNEIKQFITNHDVSHRVHHFSKDMDLLLYYLDKYPEQVVYLNDDILKKLSRDKIKECIVNGECLITEYTSPIIRCDSEYIRLYFENTDYRISINDLINNMNQEFLSYDMYVLALKKGYSYSSSSPDFIINKPEFLRSTIEYSLNYALKQKLNTLAPEVFTPELFALAIEKGYEVDEQTPKYILNNFDYLKIFFEKDVIKYIQMLSEEEITDDVINLYLKNIYDKNLHIYRDGTWHNLNSNPLFLLPDDINKDVDLAINLMQYGYFFYVLNNFDENVLESNEVKKYLKGIFPNIFDISERTEYLSASLMSSSSVFNKNPLSLPLVRFMAKDSEPYGMNIDKFKNNSELLKEFIRISVGLNFIYKLEILNDEIVNEDICSYLFESGIKFDDIFSLFYSIRDSSKLIKSAIMHGYYKSGIIKNYGLIDMIKNDDDIIKKISEYEDFDELVFLEENGIDFERYLSSEQVQCIKIYFLIENSDLKKQYAQLIYSKFKNMGNKEISLLEIFSSGDFDLVYILKNFDFEIIKKDLTDIQIQCLEIYNQLGNNVLRKQIIKLIISNLKEIETDGFVLSSIYSSGNFDLAIGLSEIDNDIIKNNLSKEQLQILRMYFSIESLKLQEKFRDYVINHPDLNMEQVSSITKIFDRISKSNSLEIRKLETEIADAIIQLDNPIGRFEQVEDVFLKNNLPTVGKIYKVFEIMHPNFQGFNFTNDLVSPTLKGKSNGGKEIIVFADLIKCFIGSNNRSLNQYLNNLEVGNKIFIDISEGMLTFEELSDDEKEILQDFIFHLNTLYNNTQKGKKDNNKELTGNIIEDIKFLKGLFSVDGTLEYNLPDRIVKMYCHFAGIDSLEQAKQYVKRKIDEADSRGRQYAGGEFTLETGDFVKGIGGIEYLGNILQNGSVSKEYLGSSAGSDATPLDTDLCIVLENNSIDTAIYKTVTDGYGPIYFVLKNRDNRFTITRRSPKEENKNVDTKMDLTKLEAFYTGAIGRGEHYGIRTGFASSEIDYIVVNTYDDRIGLEIAMNGFYIPVVDRQGKLMFSPEEYDNLRSKMNGLSYYDMGEYVPDKSIYKKFDEITIIVNGMNDNKTETKKKASLIDDGIRVGLNKVALSLRHKVDLIPNSVVLFNTGSTGRYTNLPGDGDFDFMMQVDREIYDNASKMDELRNNIIISLGGDPNTVLIVNGDIREFKTTVIDSNGKEYPVEIDITFTHKTDKTEYASDVCVSDRLKSISNDSDRDLVKANIILAKRLLKGLGAYKPRRKDESQGGMGGIGVENWILQNGGTLYSAAKSFIECADKCKGFGEFISKYKLYNFGINHMADKKGFYPHDNYIENMNSTGYEKMKQGLKLFIELYEKGVQNPCMETINRVNGNYELGTVIDKFRYDDSSQIMSDAQQILRASISGEIVVETVNMGQTGYMYQYSSDGREYLIKAGVNKSDMKVRPARACVQESASLLQKIISPETSVDVNVFGEGSFKISVQEKIKGAHSVSTDELIRNHTNELFGEYVCDYLLGNFDSDSSNFIIDGNNHLRGIDKEQSFKYLLVDGDDSLSLDFSYSPAGSRSNIYPSLFDFLRWEGISQESMEYLNKVINRLQNISDEDYIGIFKKYAYSYDSSRANEILSKILARKKYFEQNINEFINQISNNLSDSNKTL